MIVCSNCKHANLTGAMFCAECGAQLFKGDSLTTQAIEETTNRFKLGRKVKEELYPSLINGVDAWGSLHLLDTGQVLPLSSRNEFTLGRISEGQPIMPDIDLSPYQAYAAGVSRLHAVIKRDGARTVFMDLGSANGTFVNGNRLSPNVEQTVNHGDVLVLGKLKIQLLVKNT